MSFKGQNPSSKWLNFAPQSAVPTSPNEGDVFYADGTIAPPTDVEGLYVYKNGAWELILSSGAASTFNSLTLTPQSSDPSLVLGTVFNSDGTSRAAGLWVYTSAGWVQLSGQKYQEFTLKTPVPVHAVSTANLNLANQVEAGDVIDGRTLVAGNLVCLKNQTTASENGVYVVQASGAPVRDTSADSATKLNNGYCVVQTVTRGLGTGTTNGSKVFYQTSVLTSLSDNQVWAETPANYSFTVPAGVYELDVFAVGGGGGGANGVDDGASADNGGGGGAGATPARYPMLVVPGETLTISVGKGGRGGKGSGSAVQNVGENGGNSIVAGSLMTRTFYGAEGGQAGGVAGNALNSTLLGIEQVAVPGGSDSPLSGSGVAGSSSLYASGGAGGSGAPAGSYSGGGGGAGYGAGGAGGAGLASDYAHCVSVPLAGSSAGGGGGGSGNGNDIGGNGGPGGSGFVRLSWK